MKTTLVMTVVIAPILWSTELRAAQRCYSWIGEPYVKGRVRVSYQDESEYRAVHKVQRWILKDGTWVKEDDGDVTGTAASENGGFYWQALYDGKCRLKNYDGTGKTAAVIRTRFQSPQQAANADDYNVQMRPSANAKRQKYTVPGNPKEGQQKEKDNIATPATEVTVKN